MVPASTRPIRSSWAVARSGHRLTQSLFRLVVVRSSTTLNYDDQQRGWEVAMPKCLELAKSSSRGVQSDRDISGVGAPPSGVGAGDLSTSREASSSLRGHRGMFEVEWFKV